MSDSLKAAAMADEERKDRAAASKKVRAFRCSRTGLYFPADYVEGWGTKYGIGLGPTPVSEALVNNYQSVPIAGEGTDAMHPVGNCHAQVDLVEVTQAEYNENAAVLVRDDPRMVRRASIMRGRQIAHSRTMQSMYPKEVNAGSPVR